MPPMRFAGRGRVRWNSSRATLMPARDRRSCRRPASVPDAGRSPAVRSARYGESGLAGWHARNRPASERPGVDKTADLVRRNRSRSRAGRPPIHTSGFRENEAPQPLDGRPGQQTRARRRASWHREQSFPSQFREGDAGRGRTISLSGNGQSVSRQVLQVWAVEAGV